MTSETGEQWWFCLKHMRVEPDKGCPNKDRMGPYSSAEEAAGALQRSAERNRAWEEADRDD
ncbi:hypothetical protein [Thermoactinospora rubra]|uniref:hypothetical protein n=1 Tax=Thermoactinospora rubra TaxID=1088767 RepID=UPI000A1098E6|nr:hypothetical protein [Thermoactinospora rubra]